MFFSGTWIGSREQRRSSEGLEPRRASSRRCKRKRRKNIESFVWQCCKFVSVENRPFFALFKNSVSFNGNEKQGSLKESWYRPNLAGVGQFFKVNLFLVIDSRCFMGEFHYKWIGLAIPWSFKKAFKLWLWFGCNHIKKILRVATTMKFDISI